MTTEKFTKGSDLANIARAGCGYGHNENPYQIVHEDITNDMHETNKRAEAMHKNNQIVSSEDKDDEDDEDDEHDEFDEGLLNIQPRSEVPAKDGTKKRGQIMMHHVHSRSENERKVIICNVFGQPIGPVTEREDTLKEFSLFLGTLGRDYNFAALIHRSWRNVPQKDKMWDYVLKKYIVPDMAKKWVLKTIGAAWKSYKHRIKLEHFYEYNDNKTRWQKRPKTVPDQGFLTLLKLWDTKEEKERAAISRKRGKSIKNRHTMGPNSFARVLEEMKDENPEKEPPSLAELFARTRRRKEGKQYADSYDDTAKLIEDMNNFKPPEENIDKDPFLAIMGENHDGRCRLYGRGVTRKLIKKDTGAETSYIVPSEVFGSFAAATELKKSYEKDKEALEELHREILADHEKRKAELDEFQKGLESQRAEIVQDAVKIVFAALPPEIVKKYLS